MKVSSAAVLVPTNQIGEAIAGDLQRQGLQATFFKGRELDLKAEGVKVMTLYSAKGLEFPIVAIAGFRQGTSRTRESFGDDDAYREWFDNQRKVLYVGMTRAMRGLMVSVPFGCEHEVLCALSGDNWATEAGE